MRGVLHIKDFIRARQRGGSLVLSDLVRPLPNIAHTLNADAVLERFQARRAHAALVVDEFGGALGLLTMDDVIYDVMEGEVQPDGATVEHDDGSISLDGEVTLTELADDHGIEIERDDVTTLAGVVFAETGTVPSVGTTVMAGDYELVVEERSGRKLSKIRIRSGPGPSTA